jgi:hypothetical protein
VLRLHLLVPSLGMMSTNLNMFDKDVEAIPYGYGASTTEVEHQVELTH